MAHRERAPDIHIPRAWLRTQPPYLDVRLEIARHYLRDHLPVEQAAEIGLLKIGKPTYHFQPGDFGIAGVLTRRVPPTLRIHARDAESTRRLDVALFEIEGVTGGEWRPSARPAGSFVCEVSVVAIPREYERAMLERMTQAYWRARARLDGVDVRPVPAQVQSGLSIL